MSDFVNTRTILGDELTLKKLIEGSLEELNEDGIKELAAYALYKNNLINVNMPNLISIGQHGFSNESSLKNVTMNKLQTIGRLGFANCSALENITAPLLRTLSDQGFINCFNLTSISFPELTTAGSACFSNCNNLVTVDLPKLGYLPAQFFYNATNLKKIIFPKVSSITNSSVFEGCHNLNTIDLLNTEDQIRLNIGSLQKSNIQNIIIRSPRTDNVLNSSTTANFFNPNFSTLGSIYVLDDLVDTYKTKWSSVADCIYPISSYPRTEFGTITDTWEEIFAAEEDGTYETKYNIGDTKAVEINGIYIMMEIIAMNTDIRADESDVAKITWLSTNCYYPSMKFMEKDKGYSNSWENSLIRDYLNNTVYNKINNIVKNRIIKVKKSFTQFSSSSSYNTRYCDDFIWILSKRETSDPSAGGILENDGCTYPYLYNGMHKTYFFAENSWMSRTMASQPSIYLFNSAGRITVTNSVTGVSPFPIGFCT